MLNHAKPASGHPTWRGWWKPTAVGGAGGIAIAVWLDEILLFAEEILGLILLPIMAGVIYLLDILMFRARLPKEEDIEHAGSKGAKK